MPTCPSGGRRTVALPSAAASGSAELGGTIRSRPGTTARAGRPSSCGRTGSPATRHRLRAGSLSPYQERPQSRATPRANGTPSLIQSSNEATRLVTLGIEGCKPEEFAFCGKGIEEKEESLDYLNRNAARRAVDPGETIGDKGKKPPPPVLGMKIPGGGEQRQATDLGSATQRQCQGEQTAHAVPDDADGRPGALGCCRKARLQSFDNVAGQIEMTLFAARRAPIDDERPQTRTREMAQKAALGQKIKDVVAVDQRGDDQNRRADAVAAIIEQLRRTLAPHDGQRGAMAAEGMAAVGFEPGEGGLGATPHLDIDRPGCALSAERLDLRREGAQLVACRVREQRRVLRYGKGGARGQPQHRRAREMGRERSRRQAPVRALGVVRARTVHPAQDLRSAPSSGRPSSAPPPALSNRLAGR